MPRPTLHCAQNNVYQQTTESMLFELHFPPQGVYDQSNIDVENLGRTGALPQATDEMKSIRIAIRHIKIVKGVIREGEGTDSSRREIPGSR